MTPPRPNAGQRIVKRLRDVHGINLPESTELASNRPGHWQRSAGAWSFFLLTTSVPTYGSQYPARTLLACKAWQIGEMTYGMDVSIYPCEGCTRGETCTGPNP